MDNKEFFLEAIAIQLKELRGELEALNKTVAYLSRVSYFSQHSTKGLSDSDKRDFFTHIDKTIKERKEDGTRET